MRRKILLVIFMGIMVVSCSTPKEPYIKKVKSGGPEVIGFRALPFDLEDVKLLAGPFKQAMALTVDYWGGYPGSKTFDIMVDGKVIATENISNKKDGHFIDVSYDIPDKLTFGKRMITITFKAHKGNIAGPVFGIRVIKR